MKFSVAIFVNQMPLPRISDMSFTQYWQYNTLTYTSVCRCLSNVLPSICTIISLTYSCNILVVVITLAQGGQLLSFNARHIMCQLDGWYLLLLVIACYLHVAECFVMMCCETVWLHYSSVNIIDCGVINTRSRRRAERRESTDALVPWGVIYAWQLAFCYWHCSKNSN